MEITWGSDIANRFITNVGLVTTNGSHGHNIMACEWTQQLSYRPALIGISLNPRHASFENIRETKEFGLAIASTHQAVLCSVAGNESGKKVNKITIAQELGYTFYPAKKINTLLPEGASVNLECKLVKEIPIGDHTLFVGEVIEGNIIPEERSLSYHCGKYWEMTSVLEKPTSELREKIKMLFEKHKK